MTNFTTCRELDAQIAAMSTEDIEQMLHAETMRVVRDPETGRFTKAPRIMLVSETEYGPQDRAENEDIPDDYASSGFIAGAIITMLIVAAIFSAGMWVGHSI